MPTPEPENHKKYDLMITRRADGPYECVEIHGSSYGGAMLFKTTAVLKEAIDEMHRRWPDAKLVCCETNKDKVTLYYTTPQHQKSRESAVPTRVDGVETPSKTDALTKIVKDYMRSGNNDPRTAMAKIINELGLLSWGPEYPDVRLHL